MYERTRGREDVRSGLLSSCLSYFRLIFSISTSHILNQTYLPEPLLILPEPLFLSYRTPNPESRIPNPESRIPNPEFRIPNPESRIPNPEPRTPNPEPRIPNPESRTRITPDKQKEPKGYRLMPKRLPDVAMILARIRRFGSSDNPIYCIYCSYCSQVCRTKSNKQKVPKGHGSKSLKESMTD